MAQQLDRFLASNPPATNDLYVLALAGNDYIFNNQTDPAKVVDELFVLVQKIISTRNPSAIFISSIPQLGLLPFYTTKPYADKMSAISRTHNAILAVIFLDHEQSEE